MTLISKVVGGLLGVAIGDALGATTEFMTKSDIKRQYGKQTEMIGGGWLNLEPGEVTDDTQMTMCIANAIIKCEPYRNTEIYIKRLQDQIGFNFMQWFKSGPKDVGKTVSLALMNSHKGWEFAAKAAHFHMNNQSAGNGTLMRTLPMALAYADLDEMAELTVMQSKMTHFEDLADEACIIYNRIAQRLLAGGDLKMSITFEVRGTRYESILKRNPEGDPYAYVVNTFLWVLRSLYTTKSFEDAIVKLANIGHDADTTCAIAGGLAGIYYGLEGIPSRWMAQIQNLNKIIDTAARLYAIRKAHE